MVMLFFSKLISSGVRKCSLSSVSTSTLVLCCKYYGLGNEVVKYKMLLELFLPVC